MLTDAEGDCLDEMAQGLVSRYEQSHVEPPKVLYVDRDCCGIRLAQQFTGCLACRQHEKRDHYHCSFVEE